MTIAELMELCIEPSLCKVVIYNVDKDGEVWSGMGDDMFMGMGGEKLVLNANHPLVKFVWEHKEESDKTTVICEQLYDLAMLAHKPFTPDEMTKFIARSNQILMMLTK